MTDSLDDYKKQELDARKKYWDSLDKLSKKNRYKLPKISFEEQQVLEEDENQHLDNTLFLYLFPPS